jgi:hypothetical protein
MTEDTRLLVKRVWESVLSEPFQAEELLEGCIQDGGYDFQGVGLTDQMLCDIWNGATANADWHSIGFFASELLAFYQALEESFERRHLPRWVFATILMKDAIAGGFSSWDLERSKVLNVFHRWKHRLKPEDRKSLDVLFRNDKGSGLDISMI